VPPAHGLRPRYPCVDCTYDAALPDSWCCRGRQIWAIWSEGSGQARASLSRCSAPLERSAGGHPQCPLRMGCAPAPPASFRNMSFVRLCLIPGVAVDGRFGPSGVRDLARLRIAVALLRTLSKECCGHPPRAPSAWAAPPLPLRLLEACLSTVLRVRLCLIPGVALDGRFGPSGEWLRAGLRIAVALLRTLSKECWGTPPSAPAHGPRTCSPCVFEDGRGGRPKRQDNKGCWRQTGTGPDPVTAFLIGLSTT
jgi:hypothetical protein